MPPPLQALLRLMQHPEHCAGEVARLADYVAYVATTLAQPDQQDSMAALAKAGILPAVVDIFSAAGEEPGMPGLARKPGRSTWQG
jgi:hypothetical protein